MARDLHHTVAHAVSIMTLQVGGVRRRLEGDPNSHTERTDAARATGDNGLHWSQSPIPFRELRLNGQRPET